MVHLHLLHLDTELGAMAGMVLQPEDMAAVAMAMEDMVAAAVTAVAVAEATALLLRAVLTAAVVVTEAMVVPPALRKLTEEGTTELLTAPTASMVVWRTLRNKTVAMEATVAMALLATMARTVVTVAMVSQEVVAMEEAEVAAVVVVAVKTRRQKVDKARPTQKWCSRNGCFGIPRSTRSCDDCYFAGCISVS